MRYLLATIMVFLSVFSYAQGLSPEQYEVLKTLRVDNLERDTYVFFDEEGFILDRYELKPAYTFHFSDEVERKVYLYLIYPTESEDTLGSILFYEREDLTIALPLPGAGSPPETWGKYIDDLKYTGEDEPGFLACIGFVVSKEFSALLAGSNSFSEEEGEYEYCFPAQTKIMGSGGKSINIEEVSPGDSILTYSPLTGNWNHQAVESLDIHLRDSIPLITLWYLDPDADMVSGSDQLPFSSFTLTPNHPVYTSSGSTEAGKLEIGMSMMLTGKEGLVPVTILARSRTYTEKVYSLGLPSGTFVANRVLVWPK